MICGEKNEFIESKYCKIAGVMSNLLKEILGALPPPGLPNGCGESALRAVNLGATPLHPC